MVLESSPLFAAASGLQPVQPVRPAAGYIGGKRNLSRRLVALIHRTVHDGYAEPFVGGGGIFLRRDVRPAAEFINDLSGDVATFFRVLQRLYPYFIDMLRFRVTSRAEFERMSREDPSTLLDIERAIRFLYLQRVAYGGKVVGRTFGVSSGQSARFNVTRLEPMLADIHDRLAGVVIEQLPWEAFIRRYDRPGMLFYLDPPYYGSEGDYGAALFDRSQFTRMAEVLSGLRGSFYLSLNDTPPVREIFSRFAFSEVSTNYSVAGGAKARSFNELIIRGGPNATS